ncbi:hypothetical protein IJT17_02400 [bacterium]|nr:hypothetical protein [bacterium]
MMVGNPNLKNEYIGVIVAVPEEARIFKSLLSNWTSGTLAGMRSGMAYWYSHPVAMVISGQGEANARAACQALFRQYHPRFVISTGFCGALQSGVRVGDIIVSRRIYREKDVLQAIKRGEDLQNIPSWKPSHETLELAQRVCIEYKNMQVQQGRFESGMSRCWDETTVTSDHVIASSNDKLALGQKSGAISVDMESAMVGEIMSVGGIPWLAVRVVSDSADSDIPLDMNGFTDARGDVQYGSIVKEAIHNFRIIPSLVRLGLDSHKASSSLRVFMQYLFDALTDEIEEN